MNVDCFRMTMVAAVCVCVCVWLGGLLSRNLILPLEILRPFKLWYWRRLLRVPWTARRSNQSILKEINPEYSLEGLMLKLNTLASSCKELTHWKRPWCWEGLKAGGEGDDRGWDGWMASLTQWTWVWASSVRWWRMRKPGILQPMGLRRVGHDLVPNNNKYLRTSLLQESKVGPKKRKHFTTRTEAL